MRKGFRSPAWESGRGEGKSDLCFTAVGENRTQISDGQRLVEPELPWEQSTNERVWKIHPLTPRK
jgi:hypothetical protein